MRKMAWKKGLTDLTDQQRRLAEAFAAQEKSYGRRTPGNLKRAAEQANVKYNYARRCATQTWWASAVERVLCALPESLPKHPRREKPPRKASPVGGREESIALMREVLAGHLTPAQRQMADSLMDSLDGLKGLWADMAVDTDLHPRDRLKASELLARALGVFDRAKDSEPSQRVIFHFDMGEEEKIGREREQGGAQGAGAPRLEEAGGAKGLHNTTPNQAQK